MCIFHFLCSASPTETQKCAHWWSRGPLSFTATNFRLPNTAEIQMVYFCVFPHKFSVFSVNSDSKPPGVLFPVCIVISNGVTVHKHSSAFRHNRVCSSAKIMQIIWTLIFVFFYPGNNWSSLWRLTTQYFHRSPERAYLAIWWEPPGENSVVECPLWHHKNQCALAHTVYKLEQEK